MNAQELIRQIDDALEELRLAEKHFDMIANKAELIDNAIMQIIIAKNNYMYLLKQARKCGVERDKKQMYYDLLMTE